MDTEKLERVNNEYDEIFNRYNSKKEELKKFRNKLMDLINEIDLLGQEYDKVIKNNYEIRTKYEATIRMGNELGGIWYDIKYQSRQLSLVKRITQNIEEYSRRFRNTFKFY